MYNKTKLINSLELLLDKNRLEVTYPISDGAFVSLSSDLKQLISDLSVIDGELMKNHITSLLNKIAKKQYNLMVSGINMTTFAEMTANETLRMILMEYCEYWGFYNSVAIISSTECDSIPDNLLIKFDTIFIADSSEEAKIKKSRTNVPFSFSR